MYCVRKLISVYDTQLRKSPRECTRTREKAFSPFSAYISFVMVCFSSMEWELRKVKRKDEFPVIFSFNLDGVCVRVFYDVYGPRWRILSLSQCVCVCFLRLIGAQSFWCSCLFVSLFLRFMYVCCVRTIFIRHTEHSARQEISPRPPNLSLSLYFFLLCSLFFRSFARSPSTHFS